MKRNIYRIIWITGMFLTLILILLMVMTYKIRFENAVYYKYLYFYNCNDDICATTNQKEIEDKSTIYSVYKYQKKTPTFKKINDEYVKIYDNNKVVLYSMYNRIITNNYKDYSLIANKNISFIAQNENGVFGIIDKTGKKQTGFIYSKFTSYNDELIAGIYEDKYGIITLDGKKTFLDFEYDNIEIFGDFIITIKDNKLNIIDKTKKSLITKEIEITNINNVSIVKKEDIIIIKENKNNEFSEYKFDTKKKQLLN